MTDSSFAFRLGLVCLTTLGGATSASTESYALVCVTTIDSDSKESVLVGDSSPGPGKKMVMHVDANAECAALVVPLVEKGSRLANGWRPQMVTLPGWEEQIVPHSRPGWRWEKGAESFELWVFFFKRDAVGVEDMKKLVGAMQNTKADEPALTQQMKSLFELLGQRMAGQQTIAQEPKASAAQIAGSMRGTEFPWRDHAQKVVLNNALEGTLVVRHGR